MNPYLAPERVRAALRTLGLQPTRGMGQNFLIDGSVLAQIIVAAALDAGDLVVEVGPGLGVLTWELLRHVRQVVAVELDKRLAARLSVEFASYRTLRIIQGDILRLSPAQLLEGTPPAHPAPVAPGTLDQTSQTPSIPTPPPYKVVANLPYAITSAVLRHFLEGQPQPTSMVLLMQWEVAQRITAPAGDLSVLAHAVQLYAAPQIVARVPACSFFPRPAVDSAILRLQIYNAPAVAVNDIDALFRVIKAGFFQPRKKLANALPTGLAAMGQPVDRSMVIAALTAAGVSPDQRSETVTLAEWASIYQALQAAGYYDRTN